MNCEQPPEICREPWSEVGIKPQAEAWPEQLSSELHTLPSALQHLLEMAFPLDFMVISEAIAWLCNLFHMDSLCVTMGGTMQEGAGAERQPGPGRHRSGVGLRPPSGTTPKMAAQPEVASASTQDGGEGKTSCGAFQPEAAVAGVRSSGSVCLLPLSPQSPGAPGHHTSPLLFQGFFC